MPSKKASKKTPNQWHFEIKEQKQKNPHFYYFYFVRCGKSDICCQGLKIAGSTLKTTFYGFSRFKIFSVVWLEL